MKMANSRKMPTGGGKPEEAQSFDEFLDTIDDSESEEEQGDENDLTVHAGTDSDEDLDEEEVEEEEEEGEGDDEEDGSEDFDLEKELEDEGESEEEEEGAPVDGPTEEETVEAEEEESDEGDDSEGAEDDEMTIQEHKKALQRLQETDPEFFSYLKENDADLLNFDDDDSGDSSEDDEDKEDALHKPPEELEEASDSEAEEERIDTKSEDHLTKVEKFLKKGIVNLHVIAEWEAKLASTRDFQVFTNVIDAFGCAVEHILQDEETAGQKWKVEGSANFNALVRICIRHVKSFCVRYMFGSNNVALSESKFDQRPIESKEKNSQKWSKLRPKVKSYMSSLVKFLKSMGNSDAVASILRHCQKMSGFWALMTTKSYKLLRTLVSIWSQGEDTCRVLAFVTLLRVANYNREVFLLRLYKHMYMAYVSNSKFTSANTLGSINFMRRSLVELYLLDTPLTYSVAFPFIRQLAIHLRNAMTAGTPQTQGKHNKKEASKIVYSWQFVHSLHLWAELLCQGGASSDSNLKLLVYPVVQICLGAIRLIPTKKYIPLRFLIIRMLIKLQEKAGVFIPILPLITEVLTMTDFGAKSISKFSVKPLDMTCVIKADSAESGYGKAIAENVFELILASCKSIATELSFPEIMTPTLIQLRSFLKKKCKNPEVAKKFKALIEKIEANSKFVSSKRDKAFESNQVSLSDLKSQQILRVQMETSKPQPPIIDFATEYFKAHARTQAKIRKRNNETREEKLIPKPTASQPKTGKVNAKKISGPIFSTKDDESDSEEEFQTKLDAPEEEAEEEEAPQPSKRKRKAAKENGEGKKLKMKKKKKTNFKVKQSAGDAQDELVDFELSD